MITPGSIYKYGVCFFVLTTFTFLFTSVKTYCLYDCLLIQAGLIKEPACQIFLLLYFIYVDAFIYGGAAKTRHEGLLGSCSYKTLGFFCFCLNLFHNSLRRNISVGQI